MVKRKIKPAPCEIREAASILIYTKVSIGDVTGLKLSNYQRVIIVGNNGSGKSFLAKEWAAITGLPLVHLDVEYWRPNWQKPPQDEWLQKLGELTARKQWIMDGNHTDTMELRYQAADCVVFLDINRWVCLYSVWSRNGKKRTDTTQYGGEKWDKSFIRFCKGLWRFPQTRKPVILNLHKTHPHKPFIVISSRWKMSMLLDQLRAEQAKPSPSA